MDFSQQSSHKIKQKCVTKINKNNNNNKLNDSRRTAIVYAAQTGIYREIINTEPLQEHK
jgi:hypothetical protein